MDAGPPIEIRVNEPFDVVPGAVWSNGTVDAVAHWWDLDAASDTGPIDGVRTNDQDTFNLIFVHPGLGAVGSYAFYLWVNYSDGQLVNGSRAVTVVENQPPVITTGPPPVGTTDDPVAFAATVSDPDSLESTIVYCWDFDISWDSGLDGVPDNDCDSVQKSNVSHIYRAEGTYTAKLTVQDDFGAVAEAFITVVVARPPGVCERNVTIESMSFSENLTLRRYCWATYSFGAQSGHLYQYDVEVSNDAPLFVLVQASESQLDTYRLKASQTAFVPEWSSAAAASNGIHMQFRPPNDGKVFVTVDNGYLFGLGSGKAAEATVTVQDLTPPDTTPPLVDAGRNVTVLAGTPVTLAGAATDAGVPINESSHYNWTFAYNGTTVVLTGRSPAFTFEKPGAYEVTLRVTDEAGNVAEQRITITVQSQSATTATEASGSLAFSLFLFLAAIFLALAGAAAAFLIRRKDRNA